MKTADNPKTGEAFHPVVGSSTSHFVGGCGKVARSSEAGEEVIARPTGPLLPVSLISFLAGQVRCEVVGGGIMTEASKDAIRRAAIAGDVAELAQFVAAEGAAAVRLDDDPEELTALHLAAAAGQLEAVNYLLSPVVGADPLAARINNFTPLHSAAMKGHAVICEVLLRAGAGVNVQTNPQRYAPLHSAAFAGHLEAIRVLLAHGADRGLTNYRGERPADTARRQGQSEAVQLLAADPA